MLYFKVREESLSFAIKVLESFVIKTSYFEVYKGPLSFAMGALDYFAMKALYLKVYKGSLFSAIKVLDFAKMVLNRLLESSKDNLLSLWVGKVKPTHI